ncbi:hypothetical protein GIB67_006398 [Kingdonia uniflora]|uniref:Cyclic nucleotide-binding domain-containing protein n=1 Tax=Kingdonia uniflora TaxID=39325 RepID=A0A7J7P1A9_9MAGN|nr:hypothetical protein GIB67_006398 [Kingdonia uniflora]
MDYSRAKLVRFRDWSSERSLSSGSQFSSRETENSRNIGRTISSVSEGVQKGFSWGYERIKNIRKSFNFRSVSDPAETGSKSRKKVLDPQGPFLQRWNRIFVISCVIAVSMDPLFFYIPVLNGNEYCLGLDKKLETTACVLRSFTDIFYILHIIFQFRTGFIAPSSRVFGRGILVKDLVAIARRYLTSYFLIDILAVLPLPQVAILIIIPKLRGSAPLNTKNLIRFIVLLQYVPRFLRIYPLYKEVTGTSGIITETAWAGAAFNLFLYMLASHIFGALWYLFSIERIDTCWRRACTNTTSTSGCKMGDLYCNDDPSKQKTNAFLNNSCPTVVSDTTLFDFGIYLSALQSDVVESSDFPQKLFYCFWWGLRSLRCLPSIYLLFTALLVKTLELALMCGKFSSRSLFQSRGWFYLPFSLAICRFQLNPSVLLLFTFVLSTEMVNVSILQTYLQSNTVRLEEMRVKRRDAEQWMSHRLLPENLRERIRRYEQYKWQETRGVEEEKLLCNLPKDLRRDIKRHLCLALLMRVPMFEKMDEQLLDALCDRLKPALYTEVSYIVREGDPVDAMLFIMRGKLLTETTNGGRTGFFNSDTLKAGDFCGEELLTWALDPHSSSNLPISTRTVKALVEVEGFALKADDLKTVASQFRRLHSKQIRHTFRFYSQQWRTWAACFVQAAWRRYCKKKLEEALRAEEDRLKDALARGGGTSSPSLGATIYASRFAANILRAIRHNGGSRNTRLPERILPPMMLQKPAEPDFTREDSFWVLLRLRASLFPISFAGKCGKLVLKFSAFLDTLSLDAMGLHAKVPAFRLPKVVKWKFSRDLGFGSNMAAEMVMLLLGLNYCHLHNFLPLVVEMDSLIIANWYKYNNHSEVPWALANT